MPELPEVETMRRTVREVEGQRVLQVRWVRSRFRPLVVRPHRAAICRTLPGRKIQQVRRRGKYLVLVFDDRSALAFHPRMTGLVLVEDPPDWEHLRLELRLQGPGPRVLRFWDRRGLGTLELFAPGTWETQLAQGRLGPDALTISLGELRRRVGHLRAPVKVALMDQQRLAGVGNLYASEVLFQARVPPTLPCCRLEPHHWRRIHRALRTVLEEAIRYEGSTLADGTYRNALNRPGSYQNHHRVYGRAGQPCPRCKTPICRIVQAQRSTFFCPQCQKV